MTDLGPVLAALADPTRRTLLDLLVTGRSTTASQLAQHCAISRQGVVKHLGVLAEAGLVAPERHGREVRYVVRTEAVRSAADWLDARARAWDTQLAILKRAAER